MALTAAAILMQESFWWWQCSDRYNDLPLPRPPYPLPSFSPSLMSLVVSLDVKHHVYLLTTLESHATRAQWVCSTAEYSSLCKSSQQQEVQILKSEDFHVLSTAQRKQTWCLTSTETIRLCTAFRGLSFDHLVLSWSVRAMPLTHTVTLRTGQ